jgi:nicotinamidase-related amidase
MLDAKNSLLLVIDVQEKLVNALDKDIVVKRTQTLVKAAKILGIPTVFTEQYPKGLGNTVFPIKSCADKDSTYFSKTSFSAMDEDGFSDLIKKYNKKQIVISGIETHICVHQTASSLVDAGYEVHIIKDACASRNKYEFKQGIELMESEGAKISCVEIALFEWLRNAKNPKFKEVQELIK